MNNEGQPVMAENDRAWTLFFAIAVLAITSLPYMVGFLAEANGWHFTGFVFGVEDGNSYIAKMQLGAAGDWLFRSPYTPVPQQGVIAFFPYLLLGKLAGQTGSHDQLVLLFHLFRLGAGLLAILATREFLNLFLHNRSVQRWGLVLATLGAGLGWLLVLMGQDQWLGSLPLDFYSPETFGFLSIYGLPHLALARALLLWGIVALFSGLSPPIQPVEDPSDPGSRHAQKRRIPLSRAGLATGLLWVGLSLAQPLTVVVALAVTGSYAAAWLVSEWRSLLAGLEHVDRRLQIYIRRLTIAGMVCSPFVLYTAWRFQVDPFLRAWTEQNRILSPHPAHYLLAYGVMLPLLLLGIRHIRSNGTPLSRFLLWWLILLPALAYAPYNLQRRLPEGVWVAIVVISLIGLERAPISGRVRSLMLRLLPAAILPSTVLLIVGGALAAQRPANPLFRSANEIAAFDYLARAGEKGDVVLSAFSTGNALPAWAPVRVVIGHGPESASLEVLQPQVSRFFQSGTVEGSRRAWLASLDVRWVVRGPAEAALGTWEFDPTFLARAFEQGEFVVYKVSP